MVALRQLHDEGFIGLTRTDTMDTELLQRHDAEYREQLLTLSGELVEHLGPMVLDHSRWDHCVWASDDEAKEWDRLWAVIWPNKDRAIANRKFVRDATNVNTAIRYGANAFVTLDKALLTRAAGGSCCLQ